MKRSADINQILKPLSQRPTQAYISNALQVADILEWILSSHREPGQSLTPGAGAVPCPGPEAYSLKPTIYQTSFSISEEFLRRTY
ncbi:MAG: hypothetical protein K2J48_01660, partial [Muribaculaceae bacterium]|nr:hypothetical protein [Muribaculaceae bacterium]